MGYLGSSTGAKGSVRCTLVSFLLRVPTPGKYSEPEGRRGGREGGREEGREGGMVHT